MESYLSYIFMGFGGLALLAAFMRFSDSTKTLSLTKATIDQPTLSDKQLETELRKVLSGSGKIAAIKLMRTQRNLGLKEAKDIVDAFESSGVLQLSLITTNNSALDTTNNGDAIKVLIKQGKRIQAIKLMREKNQLGLKEAKEEVERMERSMK